MEQTSDSAQNIREVWEKKLIIPAFTINPWRSKVFLITNVQADSIDCGQRRTRSLFHLLPSLKVVITQTILTKVYQIVYAAPLHISNRYRSGGHRLSILFLTQV